MSPLVEYLGNATPQDNTEIINLHNDPEGNPRSIQKGSRALLSGSELRALAANYEVLVIEETDEKNPDVIPIEMPEGYDEQGYKEGETPGGVLFGPGSHPEDDSEDSTAVVDVESSPTSNPSSLASAASASPSPATPSAPAPSSSSSGAASSATPSAGSQASSAPSPASPGTSG